MTMFYTRFRSALVIAVLMSAQVIAIPLAIMPEQPVETLDEFCALMAENQEKLQGLLKEHGALLFRHFPIVTPDDFSKALKAILPENNAITYASGEGSRRWVADGVYTSTEAPPEFHIPLHQELSCTDNPLTYISFFCEIAPAPGTGQTLLGSTEAVTQRLLQQPEVWDQFDGKIIRYTSRHPPKGSFFTYLNPTQRSWQDSFETDDPQVVERICQKKGFEYHWLGDWLRVVRHAPAIRGPDQHFDHPYWCNQAHLYHANPRVRGGWLNYLLANLLYIVPTTNPYDVCFEDGSPIPQDALYAIYDILEQETVRFDWEQGDLLVLDNVKVLHGKAPYEGKRRILVSMIR